MSQDYLKNERRHEFIMHKSQKLVSVVIITYKRPIDILLRALQSVLNQTYQDIEIVVVNDNPEDVKKANEIKQIVCRENVTYLSYEKNMGACFARNFGANHTTGEFIAFLDDDDEWLPNKIMFQLNGFDDETIGMVYSPYYDNGYKKAERILGQSNKEGNIMEDLLVSNICGGCSSVMLKRIAFYDAGCFDEEMLSLQDYDLWMRVVQKYNVRYVGEPLTKKYLSVDSISINFFKKKQGWERFYEKFKEMYKEKPYCLNRRLNEIASLSIELGQINYGKEQWKKAIRITPISIYNINMPLFGVFRLIKRKVKRWINKRDYEY